MRYDIYNSFPTKHLYTESIKGFYKSFYDVDTLIEKWLKYISRHFMEKETQIFHNARGNAPSHY
jgi:hypothetical protein